MANKPDHDPISQTVRKSIIERDGGRCQLCGGSKKEGHALQVHHASDNPDHCDRNDPKNLTTLCWRCHNWIHNRPNRDGLPVDISDEGVDKLLSQDFEILQLLYSEGPMLVGEIQDRITPDHSKLAIRDRLWLIMGLDNAAESQQKQLIDHDAVTNEWGRPADISTSERGRIPENVQQLGQRIEDEQIRRALDRGVSRKIVADIFDVHPRTTRYKEHRARAYGFPLDVIDNSRTVTTSHQADDTDDSPSKQPIDTDGEATSSHDEARSKNSPVSPTAKNNVELAGEVDKSPSTKSLDDVLSAEADELSTQTDSDDDVVSSAVGDKSPSKNNQDEIDQGVAVLSGGEDTDSHRLLLTVGLDGVKKDALMAYCAEQGCSLSEMLKTWVQVFAAELAD